MHKEGYILESGQYRKAHLIAEYDWKSAIKLRVGSAEVTTTKDRFLEERPETANEKFNRERHERVVATRKAGVEMILSVLSTEPITTRKITTLAKEKGFEINAAWVHRRIQRWPELKHVVKTQTSAGSWRFSIQSVQA